MPSAATKLSVGRPATYAIRAQGRLRADWSPSLGGLTVTTTSTVKRYPIVTLTGWLSDQSALLDVLEKLYALGLPLLSVQQVCTGEDTLHAGRGSLAGNVAKTSAQRFA